ncbi:Ribosomal large subunit pseudouridine synthase C [Nymphon striatum]|nr:Ribosomal large subunit pseudouridine synthase C [Nymphon striatum]
MEKEQNKQKTHNKPVKQAVRFVTVTASHAGQRVDNFLMRELKDVPRTYVYRILRKGEVRVDKKRVKPPRKLAEGEVVRIPPVHLPEKSTVEKVPDSLLKKIQDAILQEDDDLILINKPSGLAVHGGTGVRYGLIESFRQLRPELPFIELVHRLDKETSGIVMLAKNRPTLLALHDMMKSGSIDKYYQTLVRGRWQGGRRHIKNQLLKERGKKQKVKVVDGVDDGEDPVGKTAESIFSPLQNFSTKNGEYTLLKVELLTGRMHQIRTQLADMELPVLGDSQYGDFALNREVKKQLGLKRLFLHAYYLNFVLSNTGKNYKCKIPLADDLQSAISAMEIT